ncbi:hypothetical protein GCM10025870_20240 [Agromyces marinus]|uniref:Uncharacterized protein n=1 Tax=Agromyces marinus TaxID=1389020 RepID=A0ABM8H2G8_9MICO|nr:AI-2E family transporter [Agromyces marinus]BDZ54951.1 hypothetical protein GCM10025870_20240 [Agromyces marinus]
MWVTFGLGVAQGLANWAALTLLGVPGAALWGLLSFLCSFIPNFGYFIAIIPRSSSAGSRAVGPSCSRSSSSTG